MRILEDRTCYLNGDNSELLVTKFFNLTGVDYKDDTGFKCPGKGEMICIPFPLVCDTTEHCADGSDENDEIGCGLHRGIFHLCKI